MHGSGISGIQDKDTVIELRKKRILTAELQLKNDE
jgi:hypothetical protein